MTGPLHLQPGDPLPPLSLTPPLDLRDHAGRWLLLLVDDALSVDDTEQAAEPALAEAVADFGRALDTRYLHGRSEPVAARRLGALLGEASFYPLAIAIDPRGRVQASRTGADVMDAAKQVLRAVR